MALSPDGHYLAFTEHTGSDLVIRVRIGQLSLTTDQLNLPVFAATRLARNDMESVLASGVAGLRFQLKRRDIPCITLEYDEDFVHGLPGARARIYRALEEFINLNLYDYNVKVGPTTIVP